MEIIRDSNVSELAISSGSGRRGKLRTVKMSWQIEAGEDAYRLLKEKHPYKLPADTNTIVKVAFLNRFEVVL
jgi:hypothetical protein